MTKANLLKSFTGIGDHTAKSLLITLPGLGSLSSKQIGALAGLAPFARLGQQARPAPDPRWAPHSLYMPAITAIRCNAVIRALYQRLINAGKHHYVAITACMRKMLVILNAMLNQSAVEKSSGRSLTLNAVA